MSHSEQQRGGIGWLLAIPVATAIFAAFCLGTRLPLLADDYYWLTFPLKNGAFKITELYVFARMPLQALLVSGVLKAGWIESWPMTFVCMLFAVHAAAFALLLRAFGQKVPVGIFLVGAVLFAFQPDNYEIHLWHILSMHAIGALLVAASAAIRPPKLWPLQALGFMLAMLIYDTFPLMVLGIVGLNWILGRAEWKSVARSAAVAFALNVGIKVSLGKLVGFLQVVAFERSPLNITKNFVTLFRMLGLVHFYKADWPLTLVEWAAIGLLITVILRAKLIKRRQVAWLFALPFVAALPLIFNTYPAPRAYYGPQLLRGVVLAFFLCAVLARRETRRWGVMACLLFSIAYFGQWAYVFQVKRANEAVLEAQEVNLLGEMRACTAPCVLDVPPPGQGVSKDYVLPKFVWPFYYERLRLKNFPAKDIRLNLKDTETRGASI